MFSGTLNGVLGTSYTSEDSDLVEVENSYAGLENELQSRIDNIERDNPGYDEYRYDLENIGHNPHELASYLTAKYQTYTRAEVQSELQRIFNQQYKLTLTEEVEIRYREAVSYTHLDVYKRQMNAYPDGVENFRYYIVVTTKYFKSY